MVEFTDLSGRRYETGRLTWEPDVGPGYAFDAHESLAVVSVGGPGEGAALSIGAEAFGVVIRRLVEEGAEVRPAQGIAVVAYRDPTLAEYDEANERAWEAESRVRDLEGESLREAVWRTLRRRR